MMLMIERHAKRNPLSNGIGLTEDSDTNKFAGSVTRDSVHQFSVDNII